MGGASHRSGVEPLPNACGRGLSSSWSRTTGRTGRREPARSAASEEASEPSAAAAVATEKRPAGTGPLSPALIQRRKKPNRLQARIGHRDRFEAIRQKLGVLARVVHGSRQKRTGYITRASTSQETNHWWPATRVFDWICGAYFLCLHLDHAFERNFTSPSRIGLDDPGVDSRILDNSVMTEEKLVRLPRLPKASLGAGLFCFCLRRARLT